MSLEDLGPPLVPTAAALIAEVDAAIYTGKRVARHVLSEFTNDTERILGTVAERESLVYGVGNPDESGHTVLHAMSSREGARAHYDRLRTMVDVTEWRPFTELRRDWYVFYDGVVTLTDIRTGVPGRYESIVLFPIGPEPGIQGELAWTAHLDRRVGEPRGPADPDPAPINKVANLDLHERLLAAWRAADADAVAREMAGNVGTSLRDYCGGTPYGAVYGRDAARDYYARLFAVFEPRAVDMVNIVTGDWFFFAEHRWDTICRAGPHAGARARFCTAVMFPLMKDGTVTAQIGYGTDPIYG
ncbi:MAG: hypothetical protein AB7Q97_00485 [Gammaproteobacteria bacterium]